MIFSFFFGLPGDLTLKTARALGGFFVVSVSQETMENIGQKFGVKTQKFAYFSFCTLSLSVLSLFFFMQKKGKENPPKKQGFFSLPNPENPWKEGEKAQKTRNPQTRYYEKKRKDRVLTEPKAKKRKKALSQWVLQEGTTCCQIL